MAGWASVADQRLGGWGALADRLLEQDESDAEEGMHPYGPIPAAAEADAVQPPSKPEVDDATLQALRLPIGPSAVRPSLQGVCEQTVKWIQHIDPALVELDPSISKLHEFFIESKKALHTSKEVLGRLIKIHPSKIEGGLAALADSYYHWDRLQQERLEAILSQSGLILMQYIEQVKFDETPMQISEKEVVHQPAAGQATPPGAVRGGAFEANPPHTGTRGLVIGKAATKAKLFATESSFAMVVKIPALAVPMMVMCMSVWKARLWRTSRFSAVRPPRSWSMPYCPTGLWPSMLLRSCRRSGLPRWTRLPPMLPQSAPSWLASTPGPTCSSLVMSTFWPLVIQRASAWWTGRFRASFTSHCRSALDQPWLDSARV